MPISHPATGTIPATVWVANYRGQESVTPISTTTNQAGTPIGLGSTVNTVSLAATPNGKTVYVTLSPNRVIPISTATNTAGKPIKVGKEPDAIAVTPDGRTAYVAGLGSGTVTPIATATNTPGPAIKVGQANRLGGDRDHAGWPDRLRRQRRHVARHRGADLHRYRSGREAHQRRSESAIDRDHPGREDGLRRECGHGDAYRHGDEQGRAADHDRRVTRRHRVHAGSKTAYINSYPTGTVTPISVATNTAGTTIRTPKTGFGIAITPDGKTVFVANVNGTVTPISTATNTAGTPIRVCANAVEIAVTPDGKAAYVMSSSSSVTPISTATGKAGAPIKVPPTAWTLVIVPDPAHS